MACDAWWREEMRATLEARADELGEHALATHLGAHVAGQRGRLSAEEHAEERDAMVDGRHGAALAAVGRRRHASAVEHGQLLL